MGLFFDELHDAFGDVGDVEVAFGADGHVVGFAEVAGAVAGFAHGGEDFAVHVEFEELAGEAVGHPDDAVAEFEGAGEAGVFEFAEVGAILVEDLDALIFAVGDPEFAFGAGDDAVGDFELAGGSAFAAPGLDEVTVLIELEDAGVAHGTWGVALCEEEVAVAAEGDFVGLIEEAGSGGFIPSAGFAFGAEGHEDFAGGVEFDEDVGAAVGDPDVAVGIDAHGVGTISKQAFAEGAEHFAVFVEFGDGDGSAVEDPEVTVFVEGDVAGESEGEAGGDLEAVVGLKAVVEQGSLLLDEILGVGGALGESRRAN